MAQSPSVSNDIHWTLFGHKLPKSEAVFAAQVILIYIVVISGIINLSLQNGDTNLWTALLSLALGSVLPNPSLKISPKSGHLQSSFNSV